MRATTLGQCCPRPKTSCLRTASARAWLTWHAQRSRVTLLRPSMPMRAPTGSYGSMSTSPRSARWFGDRVRRAYPPARGVTLRVAPSLAASPRWWLASSFGVRWCCPTTRCPPGCVGACSSTTRRRPPSSCRRSPAADRIELLLTS